MLIRDLKKVDRIAWISMRTKLWPEAPIDELIRETFVITDEEQLEERKLKYKVFILEDEKGKLFGFVEVFVEMSVNYGNLNSHNDAVTGLIKGWYVENSFRRHGFGKKLIEEAEKWTMNMGGSEIISEINVNRKIGIEAYKALGYMEIFKDDKNMKVMKQLK